jgi:16S rRNA (guanine(966)-N(2))-methyltransferase RsmD
MRIIAGTHKGRRLRAPDWPGLRPTSDRLRETLFNVIAARVAGARVLDGYAGTGAVGIEALSRGARHVVFVEREPRACRLIEQNLRGCGISGGYAIVARAFGPAVADASADAPDIVFLDPPYDSDEVEEALEIAALRLAPEGLVVLEHAARRDAPERVRGLVRCRRLVAGDSALSFYRATAGGDPAGPEGGDR